MMVVLLIAVAVLASRAQDDTAGGEGPGGLGAPPGGRARPPNLLTADDPDIESFTAGHAPDEEFFDLGGYLPDAIGETPVGTRRGPRPAPAAPPPRPGVPVYASTRDWKRRVPPPRVPR